MLGCCNKASPPKTPEEQSEEVSNTALNKESCESNEGCAHSGLMGKCCPTAAGEMLGCCKKRIGQSDRDGSY